MRQRKKIPFENVCNQQRQTFSMDLPVDNEKDNTTSFPGTYDCQTKVDPMLKIPTGLPFNCNKNVDIKLSVHVTGITFIGYAQSRKVGKTNNLRQEWLLREKGKFKSLDVTAICPSLLYSGIRAGSIQIYTLVSYVRTMDSPKMLYPNTLITYNRSKTLKKLEN